MGETNIDIAVPADPCVRYETSEDLHITKEDESPFHGRKCDATDASPARDAVSIMFSGCRGGEVLKGVLREVRPSGRDGARLEQGTIRSDGRSPFRGPLTMVAVELSHVIRPSTGFVASSFALRMQILQFKVLGVHVDFFGFFDDESRVFMTSTS